MKLNIGSRSVLYGVHQFFLHPLFLAAAWTRLYGAPRDPRLILAFAVHDLGYLTENTANMDGPEGERHVEFGARVMERVGGPAWGDFARYHSRFYAAQHGQTFSRLCVADKLAPTLEWRWAYLGRALLTGEIWEYLTEFCYGKYVPLMGETAQTLQVTRADLEARRINRRTLRAMVQWHGITMAYLRDWAWDHRDAATPEPSARVRQQTGIGKLSALETR